MRYFCPLRTPNPGKTVENGFVNSREEPYLLYHCYLDTNHWWGIPVSWHLNVITTRDKSDMQERLLVLTKQKVTKNHESLSFSPTQLTYRDFNFKFFFEMPKPSFFVVSNFFFSSSVDAFLSFRSKSCLDFDHKTCPPPSQDSLFFCHMLVFRNHSQPFALPMTLTTFSLGVKTFPEIKVELFI